MKLIISFHVGFTSETVEAEAFAFYTVGVEHSAELKHQWLQAVLHEQSEPE